MAQHTAVLRQTLHFTRVDFTDLRAWLNRLPLQQISSLYYHDEDLAASGLIDLIQLRGIRGAIATLPFA